MSPDSKSGASRLKGYLTTGTARNDTANRERDVARLAATFRELDSIFRNAIHRGFGIKNKSTNPVNESGSWKADIQLREETLTQIDDLISRNEGKDDFHYIQDTEILLFWTLAMNLLELEHNGFPGRTIFEGGTNVKYPKPSISSTGWNSHTDHVQTGAAVLPWRVLEAARDGTFQDIDLFTAVHIRVVKLDGFLQRTCSAPIVIQRLSFAAQIDKAWPTAIYQPEPFGGVNRNIVVAYPRQQVFNQNQTILVTIIVGFISIAGAVLTLLGFQRTPNAAESWTDANFFSLCQGSLLQISQNVILLVTIFLSKPNIAQQAKIWAWSFAALSVITSIASIPVYGLISPGWSTICVALGGISQMWISVMLMFIVSK
ncbi:hypothetical protein V496_00016 [Pseudogymnoascus sp. VKM F-4515 (FW-2607)]|nr:hypothetical protein V496_00016 [Pseudogymnoascus sp. VKM F-4515 (FW-2607)]KFY96173.1 hypothetical protein V498_02848 [Pseudogymnoascus sp. VKM F-4517 (FW-2822)]